jgi:hypothetical protein
VIDIIFKGFTKVISGVAFTLAPLIIAFILMQIISLKLSKKQLIKIIRGLILTFIGLVLLLQGIDMGFVDTGFIIGSTISSFKNNWIIIPISFILGFIITLAEPAVHILNVQIEKVTSGYINKNVVLYSLAIGVALSMMLSMIRIFTNIPLLYIIIPGYILVLILMKFTSSLFVTIAFDSGGVVTGPMIATFLLAFMLGSSGVIAKGNPLIMGLGMISIVSLVPIITILILGII